uniref:Rpn11/EIF3F C-terminal domain-containing protein n=1 Tax=Acrobeloides nanus TaxID=290746 RepID=A0A914CAA8_9BILA
MPEINDSFNQEMLQMMKRSTPSEQVVGWFFTVSDLTESCEMYHDYYSRLVSDISMRKEQPPIILLTMDVSFSVENQARLPVRAYVRAEAGIPNKQQNHAVIFQPLKVELDAFPGEAVALGVVQKGTDAKDRTALLDVGIEHLEKSTEEMINWLERLQTYVNEVLKQKEMPSDSSMGRRLMDIVNTANTQLPPEKLERLVKNSLRDYMMISYLANLTKTQLSLQERMLIG